MEYLKRKTRWYHVLVIPILISLAVPIVLLDIWVEFYHRLCFPLYKFPLVKRKSYIKIDRHRLKYLSWWQKLYCVYCGYANGVAAYWVRIAGETERYWCGIQHQRTPNFVFQPHQESFAPYGDKDSFEQKYKRS